MALDFSAFGASSTPSKTRASGFDFSAFNYPIIITNIGNCNKEEIKDMFMKTMDTLFEQAWDKRS